jgi:hypothetical protein
MLVWPFIRAIVLVMSCRNSRKFAGIPAKWDSLNLGSKRLNSLFATTSDKQEYNIDSMQKQTTRFSIVVFF